MSSLSRLLCRSFSTSVRTTSQLNDLPKEGELRKLVDKFKKSSDHYRFRTRVRIYQATVRRLASANQFRCIEEILEHQKRYKDMSKEGFAVRLISLYGDSGMLDQAYKLFDEMPAHKCNRTVMSFNALLGACVNAKQFDKVDGYFRELPPKLMIKPDVYSYNIKIKALCEMGSLDSAFTVVDEMEKNGFRPDLITFNTMLDAFFLKHRFVDGERIWALMEKKNVAPDIRSYNAKLSGLAGERKMSEAVKLIEELETKGFKPDVFSYNALIRGYCNDGNLEEAKKWYAKLANGGCAADKHTYSVLLPFVCEKGEFDLAFQLSENIFDKRCLVDAKVLQLVVDGLVKDSKIEKAKKIVEMAKSNNFCRYKLTVPLSK